MDDSFVTLVYTMHVVVVGLAMRELSRMGPTWPRVDRLMHQIGGVFLWVGMLLSGVASWLCVL